MLKFFKPTILILCSALFTTTGSHIEARNFSFEAITESTSPRNIRVLLERDVTEALLEVKGPYYIFNPHDGTRVASGLLGKRFMIHPVEGGLKWGEEFPGVYQIYIQPRSEETSIFVNGIQQSGTLAIYAIGSQLNIVTEIDIESYVKSVLSPQFSYPLEPEVTASLAILARTNAYFAVSNAKEVCWNVLASEVGYWGAPLLSAQSPIGKAVDSTKHLILVNSRDGEANPFAASWTEHSAGKTAPYHAIFRKQTASPSMGVEAPHAALDRKEAKWSYALHKTTLAHLLDLSQIQDLELFTDAPSGKVYGVRIRNGQENIDLDFLSFQDLLGKQNLQSSDFTTTTTEDSVTFTGFGKGHGVGLCLYSACAMAQNGENAIKILAKFFPETFLMNLNALPETMR